MANEIELDTLCEDLLKILHFAHTSSNAMSKIEVGIRTVCQRMKEINSYQKKDVVHALDYLIQIQLVKETFQERIGQGNVKQKISIKYKISDLGIAYTEKPTLFKPSLKYIGGIDVERIGSLSVIGEYSTAVINRKHEKFGENLEDILYKIQNNTDKLSGENKEIISLLKAIESMLLIDNPDEGLLENMKSKICEIVTSEASNQIKAMILNLFMNWNG